MDPWAVDVAAAGAYLDAEVDTMKRAREELDAKVRDAGKAGAPGKARPWVIYRAGGN